MACCTSGFGLGLECWSSGLVKRLVPLSCASCMGSWCRVSLVKGFISRSMLNCQLSVIEQPFAKSKGHDSRPSGASLPAKRQTRNTKYDSRAGKPPAAQAWAGYRVASVAHEGCTPAPAAAGGSPATKQLPGNAIACTKHKLRRVGGTDVVFFRGQRSLCATNS